MDYEKKYKEALERAKMILCNVCEGSASANDIETIFPELAESDDERIRKEIIHYILYKASGISAEQEHAWIAYLEKQKERKPAEWRDRLKDEIKHLKIDVYDQSHQFDLGARSSLTFLESFIDSLTQEQPEVDLEEAAK